MKVSTIGSHSSLQILHGAKMEGFQTSVITDTKREKFYQQFNFIDKVLAFKDIDEAVDLINSEEDSVLIPHGSLVEYLGQERVNKIK